MWRHPAEVSRNLLLIAISIRRLIFVKQNPVVRWADHSRRAKRHSAYRTLVSEEQRDIPQNRDIRFRPFPSDFHQTTLELAMSCCGSRVPDLRTSFFSRVNHGEGGPRFLRTLFAKIRCIPLDDVYPSTCHSRTAPPGQWILRGSAALYKRPNPRIRRSPMGRGWHRIPLPWAAALAGDPEGGWLSRSELPAIGTYDSNDRLQMRIAGT